MGKINLHSGIFFSESLNRFWNLNPAFFQPLRHRNKEEGAEMFQPIKHFEKWKFNLCLHTGTARAMGHSGFILVEMSNCFQVPTTRGSSATSSAQRAAKTSGQHKQTGFVPTICGITGTSTGLYAPPHSLPPCDALSANP